MTGWGRFRRNKLGRCVHRGHLFGFRTCWKPWTYDGYCAQHNLSCHVRCDTNVIKGGYGLYDPQDAP